MAPGYIIVWRPPASCGRHICTQFNPSTVKVIPWYLRLDAPVIYTGAFLISQLGRGPICNNHPLFIFKNFTCEFFLHVCLHPPSHTFYKIILKDNNSWKKHKKKLLELQQKNKILIRRGPSPYVILARLIII